MTSRHILVLLVFLFSFYGTGISAFQWHTPPSFTPKSLKSKAFTFSKMKLRPTKSIRKPIHFSHRMQRTSFFGMKSRFPRISGRPMRHYHSMRLSKPRKVGSLSMSRHKGRMNTLKMRHHFRKFHSPKLHRR